MSQCPLCLREIEADRAAFVCTGVCDELDDPQFSRHFGATRRSRTLTIVDRGEDGKTWSVPRNQPCRKCKGTTTECCRSCHYPFPPKWRDADTLTIGFAGPRSTGKTISIATLVHALRQFGDTHGWKVTHATRLSRDTYELHYQVPLFIMRGLLPPTPMANTADAPQLEPIILSIGRVGGRSVNVVLKDAAGEELETTPEVEHLKFLGRADLVVFLFDPTQVQEVKDQVKDLMPVNKQDLSDKPLTVLENLLRVVGDGSPRMAVTIAKLDALWEIGKGSLVANGKGGTDFLQVSRAMANLGSALRTDLVWPVGGAVVDDDLLRVHYEARGLLTLLHANQLLNTVEQSSLGRAGRVAYFASSALGHPPNSQGTSAHGIAPYRVIDPILWLLRLERLI